MRLFFLRHADAEISGTLSDVDRRLTPAGIEEAQVVAQAIRAMKLNFTIGIMSPTVRARQTLDIVTKHLPSLPTRTLGQLMSNADPHDLLRELQSFARDSRVLLVSHEPFVSHCIASLIEASEEPRISMKKATLACVEVGSPVQRGAGVLLWLLTNEQMRLMKV